MINNLDIFNPEPYIQFGSGAIQRPVWDRLRDYAIEHEVRSVVEFGIGISSILFSHIKSIEYIETWETDERWMKKIFPLLDHNRHQVIRYKYSDTEPFFTNPHNFCGADMGFVDGPSGGGGDGRGKAMLHCACRCRVVFTHDSQRKGEAEAIRQIFDAWVLKVFNNALHLFERP